MKTLEGLIEDFNTVPFLFIGSGLSIRYFNLPNWTNLLKDMTAKISNNEFAYQKYKQTAKEYENPYGLNPKIATLIEKDFNKLWFENEKIRTIDEYYINKVKEGCSPFKAEMAYYFKQKSILNNKYKDEVRLFSNIVKKSVAGIITTNYDLFLDKYVSGFKVYPSQEELLFSPLQGIAEIYKIHGSIKDPKTIIIDENDYKKFKEKSDYLAAKLLTIFVEYPIIFMGYSISDSNIRDILKSIVKCLSKDQVKLLKKRFIFIEYDPDVKDYEIGESYISLDSDQTLEMTKIKLSDFSLLYNAMSKKRMKIPVRLLRILKDELYLYTLTNEPTKNIKVASIDDERIANDELVLSIGTTESASLNGLRGITVDQWYKNIVMNDLKYDDKDLLAFAPTLAKQVSGKIPINSLYKESYQNIEGIDKLLVKDFDDIISKTIKKDSSRHPEIGFKEIIQSNYNQTKEMLHIAYLHEDQFELTELENYLRKTFQESPEILSNKIPQLRTNLRRLIRIYDYLKGKQTKSL